MSTKLGFKIFIGLLVMVPIITLFMVIGLERNYVEQLKEEHSAMLEQRSAIHKRSPLEQKQEKDSSIYERRKRSRGIYLDKRKDDSHKSMFQAPAETPGMQSVPSASNLYSLLKERKTYELRMEKSMQESWWYIKSQLSELKSGKIPSDKMESYLTDTINSMKDQYDVARKWYTELKSGSSIDNPSQLNWEYWQKNVSAEMQSLMQRRLHHLQNPPNCDTARKLVCQVGKTCGFGCQMHHVTYCFILAYASERTLVLDSRGWSYNSRGWNSVFQPVSSCENSGSHGGIWTLTATQRVVSLPPVDSLSLRPKQLPMAVPSDLVDRLMSFHGSPFAWFASQFVNYLMRPSSELEQFVRNKKAEIRLDTVNGPIVGVHVRRTDKRSEARYHELSEYMEHVNAWYEWYEMAHDEEVTRQVYIATDEPTVLQEAHKLYPQYTIYSDASITHLASKTSTRYSADSLLGVIFDVTALSECDFLVCTFSSQVCRLAYELMQNSHVDASRKYYSLDDIYYFGGQQAHNVQAIQNHDSSKQTSHDNELSFQTGDLMGIAGNEKNGYSVGRHVSSRKRGQYPSYKVEDEVLVADFPTYHDV